MAGIDATKVLVGAPDQSGVSGAIACAPLGATPLLPEDARTPLDVAYRSGGYVTSEGIKVTPEYNTTDINDWNGELVKKVLESFTGTVTFSMLQFDEDSARLVVGESNVTVSPATETSGKQMTIALGAELPPAQKYVFNMKDGAARIRICLPNAQPTTLNEMDFVKTDAIKLGTALACYPDTSGKSIYIHTDDGVFSA